MAEAKSSVTSSATRPEVRGKFLFVQGRKFWVKGVSYGAFRPDDAGNEYTDARQIDADFEQMAANGINTVRIPHTVPPRHLLDSAHRHGLHVMVGLSAEQYAGYLADRTDAPDFIALIRARVRAVAGHPALLCYAVGNEIQASLVRWIGRRRVERYIRQVFQAIKSEDPGGLVTYVNYPTTEYLELPFLDLLAFNVYLESREQLAAYLPRLHNLAGDRPLLMSEVGLDSIRNGDETQAETLEWQISTAFAEGCVGVVVFAWTDEWYRGEDAVDDWAFGLTHADRTPKPALDAVVAAWSQAPFEVRSDWPLVSVVVCSFNGASTIRDTLEGLQLMHYPNYEVIVVNDGSSDATLDIARRYDVHLISTENMGLSNARNTGWASASGEIVAYIDDDAYPDPDWLYYLVHRFQTSDFVGVGGPNIAPPGDGWIAECVYNAPGGPVQVLLTDIEAEHIPGCNMAFRRDALAAIDGFDPRYRAAGDDVDVCWRLQANGGRLGFHAGAMDWHHRRNSVTTYWKQQQGYGKAEALLEQKWPERYNNAGHTTWAGRLYGQGFTLPLGRRQRIYGGVMGLAPFQSIYEIGAPSLALLPLMPEWYLVAAGIGALALLGPLWPPLAWALPVFALAIVIPVGQAAVSASRSTFMYDTSLTRGDIAQRWLLTTALHLVQPLARLIGRIRHGLTPWRRRGKPAWARPQRREVAIWTEQWASAESRPVTFTTELAADNQRFSCGGPFDRFDVHVPGGLLGAARMRMAVEDHGGGAHYIRVRVWPCCSTMTVVVTAVAGSAGLLALGNGAVIAGGVLAVAAMIAAAYTARECGFATGALLQALNRFQATVSTAKAE